MLIDIHSHILPNIDDGPKSLEKAREMLIAYKKSEVDSVIATPHFHFESDNLDDFLKLRDASYKDTLKIIEDNNLKLNLKLGAEIMYSSNLDAYDLSQLTLANSDYLLIELSVRRSPLRLKDTLYKLISKGYIIILAHIERYYYLLDDSELMLELINMGVLFQVNSSFVLDDKNKNLIKALIKNNLIHFIASDAHNTDTRLPNLHLAMDKLENNYDISKFKENANKVLLNDLINIEKPKKLRKIFNHYF